MRPRARARAVLAGMLLAAGAVIPTAADESADRPCPIESLVRGKTQTPAAWRAAVEASAGHDGPACRSAALGVLALVDGGPVAACGALERLEATAGAGEDAASASVMAELAWRCGRPRQAHAAALRALEREERNAWAWSVLGKVLEARYRYAPARRAYLRALDVAPGAIEPLRGVARLIGDRKARASWLERYLDAALAAAEPRERRRAVLDTMALDEALGDRRLWIVDRAELPGAISLDAFASRPGRIAAWLFPVEISNGRRVTALLDSGASGLHLAHRAARRTDMEGLTGGTLFGGGGTAEHEVQRGVLERLDFGPLAFRDALGVAAAGDLHRRGRFQAIVGLDVFSGLRVLLDGPRGELWLYEAPGADDADDAEDEDPRAVDPWPSEDREVPLLRVAGQLLVPVALRDPYGRLAAEGLALLDTGATASMLSPAAAAAVGRTRRGKSPGLRGYGGRLEVVGAVRRADVELAGVRTRLHDVPVVPDLLVRGRLGGADVMAVVGLDVLAQRRLVLDLDRGVLQPLD